MSALNIVGDYEEKAPRVFAVWPENLPTLRVFLAVCTQWRTSMSGVVGLDYSVLFPVMKLYNVENEREVFDGVQAMEFAILALIQKK